MDGPKFAELARQDVERQQLQGWADNYGKLTLARPESGSIAAGGDKLAEKLAEGTVDLYLARVAAVLKHTRRELKWITSDQVTDVTKMDKPQGRQRYRSPDEQSRLRAACRKSRSPDPYAFAITAIATGSGRGHDV